MSTRKLTLDDILDQRAYERERPEIQRRLIALRRRRRVAVGPVVSLSFENRETIWYQIQEMARAEKMASDAAIQAELDAYNPLIPEPGQLSATLFIELGNDTSMREWLPKLVGIERSVVLRVGGGNGAGPAEEVRSVAEAAHAESLTREEVTAAVHYIGFALTPAQVDRFAAGPVVVAVDHPAYRESTTLSEDTRRELLSDLAEDRPDPA